ncbi:MAG: hypothetical protein M1838_000606 [Thelocarpon superellum]|nr:MAG: hypothetical protein M1838_000606 [Thelocarpon superellum]
MDASLTEKLDKIRSPKLQNQHQTAIVLSAVEDTLRDQKTEFTPTAYFAAILALLSQSISSTTGLVNKELATSVVYLLDLVTPFTPQPLLRAKFSQILVHLAPALTLREAEAPLLRSAIGCLEALLVAQDGPAWAVPASDVGPRRAVSGLLTLAVDHRPKVRKRAQDALVTVLNRPPPSPSVDHPAADMCAETSLRSLSDLATAKAKNRKRRTDGQDHHEPGLMHALQLVKTIAATARGWPSRRIEPLGEVLLNISKSSHEYLTMAAFEVFEMVFKGMADEISSAKLPRLMEVILDLRPAQNDSQLLPPWIAVIARGYDVMAQVSPDETWDKLPELFDLIRSFLASSSHNIRISASEGLISLVATCVPDHVIVTPSIYDEKTLEKLARSATDLLSVKYQAAWPEVFNVLGFMFETWKWRSDPYLTTVVKTVGELRASDVFTGKKEADEVIGAAVTAMGPQLVLNILPLNLARPQAGEPGRAWLLPILRDHISQTYLTHFRSEFVPLSEIMFQRVIDHGNAERTVEIKIFETLVQQIWSLLPGYCDLPLDLTEAFDQSFAELVSNILYQQVDLRAEVCRALQTLVDTNTAVLSEDHVSGEVTLRRVSKDQAQKNINHLATVAGNLLAVLFNVYSQTLPQSRGYILRCINAYLSITPASELMTTFAKVIEMLETSLQDGPPQTQADKQRQPKSKDEMPPASHTFMDLIITMAIYLPRDSYVTLFNMAAVIILREDDPQLQKKAYKLIPRLAESESGRTALRERNVELQGLLLTSAEKTSSAARRDRLMAVTQIVDFLPSSDLHFIPSVLSEVVISAKEVNEKARTAAFDLLVLMGRKMQQGGTVVNSKVGHMPDDAPDVEASLEEYMTMVSAGLAGSTPHMISASITALTRILYHFRESLSSTLLTDLVSTLDLFLTSNNREIVRSVLGFVKVCVISLPTNLMLPRLSSLVPNLMIWSHEHKAHFKAKVKHIIERMIRRFGVDVVERACPEADHKLITNIRKAKERSKRKKKSEGEGEGNVEADDDDEDHVRGKKNRFESEFDEAVYGSDDSGEESEADDGEEPYLSSRRKKGNERDKTYIVEDEDEPLDLLDRRTLASISSTKPTHKRTPRPFTKTNVDQDGKLILGKARTKTMTTHDKMVVDGSSVVTTGANGDKNPGAVESGSGVNAYLEALKGKDAVQRGQRGRLKYSNAGHKQGGVDEDDGGEGDEDMMMDVDATERRQGPRK